MASRTRRKAVKSSVESARRSVGGDDSHDSDVSRHARQRDGLRSGAANQSTDGYKKRGRRSIKAGGLDGSNKASGSGGGQGAGPTPSVSSGSVSLAQSTGSCGTEQDQIWCSNKAADSVRDVGVTDKTSGIYPSEDTSPLGMSSEGNIRRSRRARKSKSALELLGMKIKKEPDDDYEPRQADSRKSEASLSETNSSLAAGTVASTARSFAVVADKARAPLRHELQQNPRRDVRSAEHRALRDGMSNIVSSSPAQSDALSQSEKRNAPIEVRPPVVTKGVKKLDLRNMGNTSPVTKLLPSHQGSASTASQGKVSASTASQGKVSASTASQGKVSKSGRMINNPHRLKDYTTIKDSGQELETTSNRKTHNDGSYEEKFETPFIIQNEILKIESSESEDHEYVHDSQLDPFSGLLKTSYIIGGHEDGSVYTVKDKYPERERIYPKTKAFPKFPLPEPSHPEISPTTKQDENMSVPLDDSQIVIKPDPDGAETSDGDFVLHIEEGSYVTQPPIQLESGEVLSADGLVQKQDNQEQILDDAQIIEAIPIADMGDSQSASEEMQAAVSSTEDQSTDTVSQKPSPNAGKQPHLDEAMIKLAQQVVEQVEGYDQNMVYRVEYGEGKVTHFMFKPPEGSSIKGPSSPKPSQLSTKASGMKSSHRGPHAAGAPSHPGVAVLSGKCAPVTSDELDELESHRGRTAGGRQRPVKQIIVKEEFQEIIERLQPTDCMENHVMFENDPESESAPRLKRSRLMTCRYCKVILTDRHHFRKHIRQHIDYRPFACPICDYKAQIKATIARHINIHSEVMPYVCVLCGRGFNFKQKLQVHMKYHKGVRDQPCPHCSMSFHEFKTLRNHVRTIHGKVLASQDIRRKLSRGEKQMNNVPIFDTLIKSERSASVLESHATIKTERNRNVEFLDKLPESDHPQTPVDISQPDQSTAEQRQEPSGQRDEASDGDDSDQSYGHIAGAFSESHCGGKTSLSPLQQDHGEMTESDARDAGMASHHGNVVENEETVEFTTAPHSVSMLPRRLKSSRCTGPRKTQLIMQRYMQGMSKFGASHKEIEASRPWKISAKNQNQGDSDCSNVTVHVVTPAGDKTPTISLSQAPVPEDHNADSVTDTDRPPDAPAEQPPTDLDTQSAHSSHPDTKSARRPNPDTKSARRSHPDTQPARHPLPEPSVSLELIKDRITQYATITEYSAHDNMFAPGPGRPLTTYSCKLCSEEFYSKTTFVQHVEVTHAEVKLWECPDCDYTSRLRSSLFVHRKLHEGVKKFDCKECGKAFTLGSKLRDHMIVHSQSLEHKCDQCGKQFRRRGDVKKHVYRIHSSYRPLSCEVCDKKFRDQIQLRRHMESHVEGRTLKCEVCNKYYKSRSSLHQHIKSHTCRFFCELCNKKFGSYSGFMAHKVMHTESFEGFHCDLCNKVLHTKGSLNRHLTISHSTARPFQCTQCKSAFKTKKDLRNHAIVHTSTKDFECSKCGFKSKRYESLQVHMKRHQDVKPYRCGICGREYTQKRSLQMHLPYHISELQIRCPHCKKRCMSKQALDHHVKKNHRNLQREGEDQMPVTFYMCEECNSVFLTQDNLAVHILVEHMHQPQTGPTMTESDGGQRESKYGVTDPSLNVTGPEPELTTEIITMELPTDALDEIAADDKDLAGLDDAGVMDAVMEQVPKTEAMTPGDNLTYVTITDPKSNKKTITLMNPLYGDSGTEGVEVLGQAGPDMEVQGEVVLQEDLALHKDTSQTSLKLGQALSDAQNAGNLSLILPQSDSLETTREDLTGQTVVSFVDPDTQEPLSVTLPGQALENLLIPAMETEVSLSEELSPAGDEALVDRHSTVQLSDTLVITDCQYTTDTMESTDFTVQ